MKRYQVSRTPTGIVVLVNGQPLPHVIYHSPTGFEWGYGGSGPADLALSILADYFGEHPATETVATGSYKCWALHQLFKWERIGPAPHEGFEITDGEIAAFVNAHQEALARTLSAGDTLTR